MARKKVRRTRMRVGLGGFLSAAIIAGAGAADAGAVTLIRSDLDFMLQQIKISEAHAAGGTLSGPGPNQVSNPLFPYGLRTVDGRDNNLLAGKRSLGAADTLFRRLSPPNLGTALPLPFDPDGPGPAAIGDPTSYTQTSGIVVDPRPRTISNLIVDQTENNPAAIAAAEANPAASSVDHDGDADTPNMLEIPNQAPDVALSAPYNSWFTFFGQFFDHGLDLVTKGGSGTVMVPLADDDPLIAGADGEIGTADDPAVVPPPGQRFMVLTRATNQPGPDGVLGTADDVREHMNTTTAFVDQNQTYTSHPAHQVFLREYALNGAGKPVPTGRLIDDNPDGGIGTWADIKAQARDLLGIELRDADVLNVPMILTDQYGRFLPGSNGYPRLVMPGGVLVEGDPAANGGLGISTVGAVRTNHAFLDDIAHHAAPKGDHDGNPATPAQDLTPDADPGVSDDGLAATYDDEMLGAHFITGDGRGNENIGLTSVHHVFHAEHNRMVDQIKGLVTATGDAAFIAQWQTSPGVWNGERLFQAARFSTEMQYQHLVFEEFARKIQPQVNVFAGYANDIDPAITAEFAHTVYRFGHSMLNETVPRTNADGSANDIGLIEAFLNPQAYTDGGSAGALTSDEAAGAVVRGTTRQRGNELDEFVTEALRNNLLGLPLDLSVLNLARGRDTGVPTLNAARRQFYAQTTHSALQPYESWADFTLGLRNPASAVNFIAAYGTHPTITAESGFRAKRAAAEAIVGNQPVVLGARTFDPPSDRHNFLNSLGAWTSDAQGVTNTGLDDVDFWMGGLAEKTMPFGGMLGSTFNYVFETQMEALQDGDRFYYLSRLAGLNFLTQLEENSFAKIVMRNTDATRLPADVFSRPDFIIEAGDPSTWFIPNDPSTAANEFRQHTSLQGDTLRFVGGEHVVMGGTAGVDRLRADEGDDTFWGEGGKDRLEGQAGNDQFNGGPGNDIITDTFGDDNIKGDEGNDAINAGSGFDLIFGGTGKDFTTGGADPKETFGGTGGDVIDAGDSADTVFGNEGDDWIEGGDQADLLQGGNGDPFQNDTLTGDDVINGGSGNDDYDAEGGDDIMVSGPGIERSEGMLGFDWAINKGDAQPGDTDLNRRVFVRPDEDAVRDRYDMVEGVSGWDKNDVLRGDSRTADGGAAAEGTMVGHELNNPGLINGLQAVLGAGVTQFTGGNIILGGAGSDLIEGRGGNDLIDGDRWLNVQLEAPNPATSDPGDTKRVDAMGALKADVFAGKIDPGDIHIVRTIETSTPGPADIDTAEFSDVRANYEVIPSASDPTVVTVIHSGGAGIDGTDTLRNVERAKFSDQTIEITDIPTNSPAAGAPAISDLTPVEGQTLTASIGTVSDGDGIAPGSLAFAWQSEIDTGFWTTVGSGTTFTPGPDEVGLALRVVATFQDGDGVLESANSAATAAVENLNDAPTGAPVLDDTTPSEGAQIVASTTGIRDLDGLEGVAFAHQWQTSGDGGATWADIGGATSAAFTPTAAQVGLRLRDRVSFTDNNGTAETVASDMTAPVTAIPPVAAPPPSGFASGPGLRLALAKPVVPRVLDAGTVAAKGVTVKFTAPRSTTLVRVRVFKVGSKSLLAKTVIRAKHGRVTLVLRHPSIVRVLRRGGTFRIEMTPGVSRTQWGMTTTKRITIRR